MFFHTKVFIHRSSHKRKFIHAKYFSNGCLPTRRFFFGAGLLQLVHCGQIRLGYNLCGRLPFMRTLPQCNVASFLVCGLLFQRCPTERPAPLTVRWHNESLHNLRKIQITSTNPRIASQMIPRRARRTQTTTIEPTWETDTNSVY